MLCGGWVCRVDRAPACSAVPETKWRLARSSFGCASACRDDIAGLFWLEEEEEVKEEKEDGVTDLEEVANAVVVEDDCKEDGTVTEGDSFFCAA